MEITKIILAQRLLYFTYMFVPIVAGLDKFFYIIADWNIYLNQAIPAFLHLSPELLIQTVGVIEIIAGVIVFINPKIGGSIVAAWLVLISINLVSMGSYQPVGYLHARTYYDIAIRDMTMAVGACALALLSDALKSSPSKP